MAGFLLEEFSQDGLASLLFSSRSLRKKDISTPNCSKRSAKSRFPSPASSQFKRNLTADSPFSIPSGRKKLRRVSRRCTIRILIAIAYWGQAMSIYRPFGTVPRLPIFRMAGSSFEWRKPLRAIHNASVITLMPSQSSTPTTIASIKNAQRIIVM